MGSPRPILSSSTSSIATTVATFVPRPPCLAPGVGVNRRAMLQIGKSAALRATRAAMTRNGPC
ncbi:MAG: hypothetical protein WA085_07845, partial [Sphingobium sp.]